MFLEYAVDVAVQRPSVEEPGVVGHDPVHPVEVHPVVHEVQHRVNTRLTSANHEVILRTVSDASQT